MKKILLASLFMWTQLALAADPPVSIKGQSGTKQVPKWNLNVPFNQATNLGGIDALIETGNMNLLADPGMEAPNTSSWAADSGATISKTTTAANVAFGSRAMQVVTTTSGSLRSVAIPVPEGLKGQNGYAQCRMKITSANTGAFLYVSTSTTSLTNMLAYSSTVSGTAATNYTNVSVNFVWPTSGSVYLWLDNSSSQTTQVDDCYIGPASNLSQVSQARLLGKIRISGCSDWATGSTSFTSFTAATGCTYVTEGLASAPSTMKPAIKLSSIPAGAIFIVSRGYFGKTVSGTNGDAVFRFSDGTNSFSEQVAYSAVSASGHNGGVGLINGSYTYSTAQSNVTLEIQGKTTNATSSTQAYISDDSGGYQNGSINGLEIEVYSFPTTSDLAISGQNQRAPTITRLTSGTAATYTVPVGAVMLKIKAVGAGGGGGGSGTSGTMTAGGAGGNTLLKDSTGTTTILQANGGNGGSALSGANPTGGTSTVNSPATQVIALQGAYGGGGQYNSSGTPNLMGGAGGSSPFGGAGNGTYASIGKDAIANSGSGGGGGGSGTTAAVFTGPGGAAGGYIEAVITNPASAYQYTIGTAGTAGAAGTSGSAGGAGGSGVIIIEEYYSFGNVPILVGSVTSNSSGTERIERVQFAACSSTPCTINGQSGSWVTSVTRSTNGNYTINIASGMYPSAPYCWGQFSNGFYGYFSSVTATTLSLTTFVTNTLTTTDTNGVTNIFCMGPK